MCHAIFDLYLFHDSNPSGPLINRFKCFWIIFLFRRIFDHKVVSAVRSTPQSLTIFLTKSTYFKIFSFMTDVFTPERISPEYPFKSNQRQAKIYIFTLWCAAIISAVWCTPHRLTPRWDAQCTPLSFLKILENTLASGAQMGLSHEKNRGSKIVWPTPFTKESNYWMERL